PCIPDAAPEVTAVRVEEAQRVLPRECREGEMTALADDAGRVAAELVVDAEPQAGLRVVEPLAEVNEAGVGIERLAFEQEAVDGAALAGFDPQAAVGEVLGASLTSPASVVTTAVEPRWLSWKKNAVPGLVGAAGLRRG